MDNVAEPATRLDTRNPLSKWVAEMQSVVTMVSALLDDSERLRAAAESAQREHAELREELGRLRAELDRQRTELTQQRAAAESVQRERDELRAEVAALQGENERLRSEQVEHGERRVDVRGRCLPSGGSRPRRLGDLFRGHCPEANRFVNAIPPAERENGNRG